jgi:Cytochrome P460
MAEELHVLFAGGQVGHPLSRMSSENTTHGRVAVSQTEDGIKAILGNPAMINANKEGIPGNGKPFPEGSMVVKIEWSKKKEPCVPYFVEVPDTLKSVSFIEKDSKRFPDTSGWGYAQF